MNNKKFFALVSITTSMLFLLQIITMFEVKEKNEEIVFNVEASRMIADKNHYELETSKEFIEENFKKLGYKKVKMVSNVVGYSHYVELTAQTSGGETITFKK